VAAREYRELEARYRQLSLAHLYRVATQKLDERRERLANLDARVAALRAKQESLREEGRRLEAEEEELKARILAAERILGGLEHGSEALRTEALRAERGSFRLEGARDREAERSRLVLRLEAELSKASSAIRRLEEETGGLEKEHSQRKRASGRLEELVARGKAEHTAAAGRLTRLTEELEALRKERERTARRLEEASTLRDEELACLREMGEKLGSYEPEGLRARSAGTLRRLEKLRRTAAGREAEANRRRGVLAALIGRTEVEIRTLRTSGHAVSGGKRLYEIVRPRPGYEAAVEAALGDLAGGVLAETLGEGMKLLSGENPAERVVVRLDAEKVVKNGAPPGKSLLDCVEILDASYAGALERLLGGAYVLEKADHTAPEKGYDVAVTREGLRFTRISASRRTPNENFARQARLAQEEKRLDVLKNRLGEKLYDSQEIIFFATKQLDEQTAEVEAFDALASRTARTTRLLVSEAGHRARKAQAVRERRSAYEVDLHRIEAKIFATEDELRGARETEKRTKEELDAALLAVEAAHVAAERVAERLARARAGLQRAREHREVFLRGLKDLKEATTADTDAPFANLSHRAAQQARCLEAATRKRLTRLRNSRSDTAKLQLRVAEKRAGHVGEAGDVAGELARATSEAAALREQLSRVEEARKAAESEIFDEWGATLESAREAAETLPETSDAERGRLARKLKNFGRRRRNRTHNTKRGRGDRGAF
jgi:chromosome segregation protein